MRHIFIDIRGFIICGKLINVLALNDKISTQGKCFMNDSTSIFFKHFTKNSSEKRTFRSI